MYELITINKTQMPIRFGMNALRLFCKATNKNLNDLSKLGQDLSLDDSVHLINAGLKDGHRKAGKEYSFTIEDVSDWLDDDINILTEAMNIFAEQFNTSGSGNDQGTSSPKKVKK